MRKSDGMEISSAKRGKTWTRDETILALGLYFQIPFGKIHSRNQVIIRYAERLGRTPAALSMKMGNIGRFDPQLAERGIVGLGNGGQMDQQVWDEFKDRPEWLASEFQRVLLKFTESGTVDTGLPTPPHADKVEERLRINQDFFRASVLSAYNNTCCITGMSEPQLLVVGHIKPLSKCVNDVERMDVQNGICLDALHSSAFERGLITVDLQYRVRLSSTLKDHLTTAIFNDYFKRYENTVIHLPRRARPAAEFLSYHNENVFVA